MFLNIYHTSTYIHVGEISIPSSSKEMAEPSWQDVFLTTKTLDIHPSSTQESAGRNLTVGIFDQQNAAHQCDIRSYWHPCLTPGRME